MFRNSIRIAAVMISVAILVGNSSLATAQQETVLLNFNLSGTTGAFPQTSLILDAAGNLYGTAVSGGSYNGGTAFEMTRNQDGSWSQTIVHAFNHTVADGDEPFGNLVFDAAGNLYGTTYYGGAYGEGVVYELSPASVGWKQTILHTFGSGPNDGANPKGGVILDHAGNLYGTT